jgi:phosphoribosyl 1,2-cyclic phosphodiesterase
MQTIDACAPLCDDSIGPHFSLATGGPFWGNRISLRVSILASGSAGNCTLLETSQTRLLVDAGLGKKETLRRLAAFEQQIDRLDGIVISHEHSDHIGGLAALLGKWRTTVYITAETHAETLRILDEGRAKRLDRVEFIQAGRQFCVGDIEVAPFDIPHDAVDPLGFTFCSGGVKVAVVTDLGYMSGLVKQHLRDSDAMVLESNHGLEMLKMGPYPWHVKQRVMSRHGHLSNEAVSEFLADADGFDARPRFLVLAHLSEENNNPHAARISAQEALNRRPSEHAFAGELLIASQDEPLRPMQL